ncbi:MAG: caspase family protein, partial [Enhydrobacter sp.]
MLIGTGGLLFSPAIVKAQGQTNGVALVIGNSKYHWEAALPNVKRDAPDVARMFQSYGLKTELVQDAGRGAMDRALQNFGKVTKGANLAAFYFAGHGATWGRDSYLVPVDADLGDPGTVETLIKTQGIGRSMREAANRLFVYDSCRNNPADGWRQVESERTALVTSERQGAPMAPNSLVLYSTSPGRIARDGPAGQNSPFASVLLRQLQPDFIDLQSVAPKLRRELLIATEGKQVLWSRSNFQQPFVLNAPPNRERISVSGGAGWAGDPARIVELPKAYAYAREN